MDLTIIILAVISLLLALNMLFSKSPITAALSLLGILVMTAGIYGLIGEHLVATLQLVVYAGAIMVLFIFSIMLLNLSTESNELKSNKLMTALGLILGSVVLLVFGYAIKEFYSGDLSQRKLGQFTPDLIHSLGGNTKVLAHSLFTEHYITFEVISIALLTAVVAAVVLAKRKFD
jgi:NADH-quinone oxidoreductase subunit J